MTSDRARAAWGGGLAALLVAGLTTAAPAAEPVYPFEGTWVRANRVCAANAPRVRTYTASDLTMATGRCTIRKVARGGSQIELFEDCRRSERPGNYTETIRMFGPDLMQVRRQTSRLKIARPLRYARCTAAAPDPQKSTPAVPPAHRPPGDAKP